MNRRHLANVLGWWRLVPWALRVAWHTARAEYHHQRGIYWRSR